MYRIAALLMMLLISLSVLAACDVTDDTGQQIKLTSPAKRIIILAPDLVESVFAAGAGNNIIGVISGSDYPAAAEKIPQVGSYSGIDLERIMILHPDLILTWKYAFPRQISALRRLGIPVYISAPRQLSDVPRLLRNIGCLTHQNKTAEQAARQFEMQISKLSVNAHAAPVKVFYLIDEHAMITVNKDSWINQVIELCGGKNIYAQLKTIAPEVSRESVLAENPDVILHGSRDDFWKRSWQAWPELSAVRQQKLMTVTPDLISRAGPRLADGAKQICDYIAEARSV